MNSNALDCRATVDLHRHAARTFVASKQRLPESREELVAWLMEFTDELGKLLNRWQEAVADKMTSELPTPEIRQARP